MISLSKKGSHRHLLLIAIFLIASGFLFVYQTKNASADTCSCAKRDGFGSYSQTISQDTATQDDCSNLCRNNGGYYRYGTIGNWLPIFNSSKSIGNTLANAAVQDIGNIASGPLAEVFKWLLLGVLKFFGWLLSVSAGIFAWSADAKSLTDVLNGDTIYKSWTLIRDLLNIAFIMVLLYTAFTIIFQVDSAGGKKRILTVVLMALLVNFSFPITRFVIDIGNSLMYTIFQNLLPQANSNFSDIFSNISNQSGLGTIIDGTYSDASVTQLIAAIVFVGLMAITFLTMSVLFLIRIIALALIIIFSPVAFVGAAVPSFSSKAGQWWDYLFKYTFFGPAMALMLYIAIQIMNSTTMSMDGAGDKFTNLASDPNTVTLVTKMSRFAIPIVILWIGMGLAQKMGIAGAEIAKKMATKAFDKVSGVGFVKQVYKDYKKERDARKEDARMKPGKWLGNKANDVQDSVYARLGSKKAQRRKDKRRDDKRRKDMDDKSKEVEDTKTTDEMVVEVNNVFNTTGTIDPNTKVNDTQAGSAKAYTKKNSDEKKDYIADQLAGKGTTAGSSLENILGGTVPKAPGTVGATRLELALWQVLNNPSPSEGDLRTVAAFVGKQSEEVMKKYVKQ